MPDRTPAMAPSMAMTVSEVNESIKMLLEGSPYLRDIWVQGEITGAKLYASSGHLYFSLKDAESVISAVLFRSSLARIPFRPENGMRVIVRGRISAYVPRGQYQLIADHMIPDGAGALAVAFEQLKSKLASEGLCDPARKRPLPPHPARIGVVTSPSGAAVHDIIRVARTRCPSTEILLFPSLVQGPEAPTSLRSGIRYFNSVRDNPEQAVDVIILGRGGGSAEDLWAFNDEALARAVAASDIPVISAVGHEVDFTICDYVADCRAATPSAAAEMALPDRQDLARRVRALAGRLSTAEGARLRDSRARLDRLRAARVLTSPEGVYRPRRERIEALAHREDRAMAVRLDRAGHALGRLSAQLGALSPLNVLSRGYALVQREGGHVVSSAHKLAAGDVADLRFSDGTARVRVEAVTPITRSEDASHD